MERRDSPVVNKIASASGAGTLTMLALLPMLVAIDTDSVYADTCYVDNRGRIVNRRRPGYQEVECPDPDTDTRPEPSTAVVPDTPHRLQPGRYKLPDRVGRNADGQSDSVSGRPRVRSRNEPSVVPRPGLDDYVDSVPVPERWRVVDALPGYSESVFDPYNRSPLKADKPLRGSGDRFFSVGIVADTIVETRDIPTGVGSSSTQNAGASDVFGDSAQSLTAQVIAAELVYYQGNTVFKPPDFEFRFTPAFSYNYTALNEVQGINADPRREDTRQDDHLGVQALFYDQHIRNVSDRYDFDSFRIGIQPFSSDFRGFLFQDNQFGARLFGIRDNNKWQYNLAWFRRLEKDTNSGLNDVSKALRRDDVFLFNLYRQDYPVLGFFSQGTIVYNVNRENNEFYFNNNEFIERPASLGREVPREYDVLYLGYSGDGHIGRVNLSTSAYYAAGTVSPGVFVDSDVTVGAAFAAAEFSIDYDWIRPRLSFMYASGDSDPYDDKATGFDAIFENPQFAGGETSYWNRQAVPLIGGGRVALSSRNSFLNALRSSKEEGQSNFTNPGLILAGIGVDMDLTPKLRMSLNLNSLAFDTTEVLEAARNQPNIDDNIGTDLSIAFIYRPMMSQNIIVRASYATLIPGEGFNDLFPDEQAGYFLFNATLNY